MKLFFQTKKSGDTSHNPKTLSSYMLFVAVLFLISTCQKPERDNPFDDKSTLKPEDWAPQNLAVEDLSITSKKLTWTYDGDSRIEGYKIDRKEGETAWQAGYKVLPKETLQFVDTLIIPSSSLVYSYRLYAYAGNQNSLSLNTNTNASDIPPPSNVAVTKITDARYKISRVDNITGEHGFKIDRKRGGVDWEMAYGTVAANSTEFTDENVFSGKSSTKNPLQMMRNSLLNRLTLKKKMIRILLQTPDLGYFTLYAITKKRLLRSAQS